MDISYNWLKRFIDFSLSPQDLAATLTSLGLECDKVEEIESVRGGLRGVVIGKVITCEPHPDSDHLHVTTVDLGQSEPVQIVCGAPNVAAGQTVVVATIGTTLYSGDKEFQIKKSKIRGVESFGMICAEDELGLGNSHDGIMVLPEEVKPGTPAAEYFDIESDWRLEVELTPNRVDAASHYGTARDLKARFVRDGVRGPVEVRLPSVETFISDTSKGAATVEVLDAEGCPRYCGITIRNVKVGPSPEWLRRLLEAAGQRPVNNIVDITNFILLGIGQPLHSFDLDKVAGEKIVVRTCPAGTKFITLDGVEHTLHESDLMICDSEKPMCIAGVFGGLDSGITEATSNVFIESAWFNPTRIRKTARRHALSTDASFRYERGTDPLLPPYAAKLAACLIKEMAGGEICGDLVDVYASPVEPIKTEFSLEYCNRLIGKEIPRELVISILRALDFTVEETENAELLRLTIPPYRVDVTRPCDVVEEILRVYGYNNVETPQRMNATLSVKATTDASYDMEQTVSEMLTARGFVEILNNSLTAKGYYEENAKYPEEKGVKILNPLSGDLGVMRQTLLYGGLESISHNINRKASDLLMYEFGNVYAYDAAKADKERPLKGYSEHHALALWATGQATLPSWNSQSAEADFYMLKGVLFDIFRRMGVNIRSLSIKQEVDDVFSAKLSISARGSDKQLCEIGVLKKKVLKKFDIEQPVVFAELDWDALFALGSRTKSEFVPLPKTMDVRRDLALLLDKAVKFAAVEDIIRKNAGKMLREVSLFDVYEGKNLPEGKKSYAVAIILGDDEKTLKDKQIDAVMQKLTSALAKELQASLR